MFFFYIALHDEKSEWGLGPYAKLEGSGITQPTRAIEQEISFYLKITNLEHAFGNSFRKLLSMNKLTVTNLNHVAILCGLHIPSAGSKGLRVECITNGLKVLGPLPKKLNILSIDIGIKNFSYCQLNGVDLSTPNLKRHKVSGWNKINLDERYGKFYSPLVSLIDPIDKKRYLNYITEELVKELIHDNLAKPDIVVFESQRTTSGSGRGSVLPTVLLNYTFETILQNAIYLQTNALIWPMSATRMASLWINRYFDKFEMKRKNSKSFRLQLFLNCIKNKQLFSLPGFTSLDEFIGLKDIELTRLILGKLNITDSREKLDDLVDSLLYGLTVVQYLKNQKSVIEILEKGGDLIKFIEEQNEKHLEFVRPFGMEVKQEFVKTDTLTELIKSLLLVKR